MKTEFVKPKEKILEDLADPIREAVLSAITPIISNAMSMHSDQQNKVTGETSDGYHTFNELYEHRHILFLALLKTRIDAWKSWNHEDGTAFEGWFIAGISDKITYHIPARLWDLFTVPELPRAPKWDGHTSNDVIERLKLLEADQQNKELRLYIQKYMGELLYPIKIYGWEISPETEPNALAAGFKFKAACDGDVKSSESVNELIEECAEETNDYFWKATDGFKAEIQRLTKEVEDSKVRLKQAVEFAGTKGGENTRLRELLERAGSMMSTVKHLEVLEVIDKDKYDQILSEINALNHKP